MKRDMDLIREVLLRVEALTERPLTSYMIYPGEPELAIDGYTPDQIAYHLDWVIDAEFVAGSVGADGHFVLQKVTWRGCEFLDDTRDPQIWQRTKERAKGLAGIGVGFLWEIAKAEVKAKLGLS